MISAFTSILHVPNLSKPDHVLSVLEEASDIFSKQELSTLAKRMSGHKYVQNNFLEITFICLNFLLFLFNNRLISRNLLNFSKSSPSPCRVFIGIKKLLDLIDMARQTEPQYRINKFLTKLEEEGGLEK